MDRVPIINNPKLFDRLVGEMQEALADALPWLDHSFGIAERLTKFYENRAFNTANIYIGEEQYMEIEPCEELGNFSFFYLKDPQVIDNNDNQRISSPFSLIVWYNLIKVSPLVDNRNREAIKGQILGALNEFHLRYGRFVMNRVYEIPENVFSDFSYVHTDNQCLMQPYAGLRIDGTLYTEIQCLP